MNSGAHFNAIALQLIPVLFQFPIAMATILYSLFKLPLFLLLFLLPSANSVSFSFESNASNILYSGDAIPTSVIQQFNCFCGYTPWNASFHSGDIVDVWITYNGSAKNLSVSWKYLKTSNTWENTSLFL